MFSHPLAESCAADPDLDTAIRLRCNRRIALLHIGIRTEVAAHIYTHCIFGEIGIFLGQNAGRRIGIAGFEKFDAINRHRPLGVTRVELAGREGNVRRLLRINLKFADVCELPFFLVGEFAELKRILIGNLARKSCARRTRGTNRNTFYLGIVTRGNLKRHSNPFIIVVIGDGQRAVLFIVGTLDIRLSVCDFILPLERIFPVNIVPLGKIDRCNDIVLLVFVFLEDGRLRIAGEPHAADLHSTAVAFIPRIRNGNGNTYFLRVFHHMTSRIRNSHFVSIPTGGRRESLRHDGLRVGVMNEYKHILAVPLKIESELRGTGEIEPRKIQRNLTAPIVFKHDCRRIGERRDITRAGNRKIARAFGNDPLKILVFINTDNIFARRNVQLLRVDRNLTFCGIAAAFDRDGNGRRAGCLCAHQPRDRNGNDRIVARSERNGFARRVGRRRQTLFGAFVERQFGFVQSDRSARFGRTARIVRVIFIAAAGDERKQHK